MTNKQLIIGIDGLDPILLSKWKKDLPNFSKIIDNSLDIKFESIYPIDSIPIWSSIYTGQTPANHGILGNIDYLGNMSDSEPHSNYLEGNTFWDIASRNGKKVCIINPFLAYPPWKVNGIMVSGPVFIKGKELSCPPEISKKYILPQMGGLVHRYPSESEFENFYNKMKQITIEEFDFSMNLLKNHDWELAFACFITLDGIEHFFWRYYDIEDPTYPGDNPYKNMIKNFYLLFDKIIGGFSDLDLDTMMIVSDHGHGMRSTKLVNVNKLLYDFGLLTTKSNLNIVEDLQTKTLNIIRKNAMFHGLLSKILIKMPNIKKLKVSGVDKKDSLVYVSDFSTDKNFGGLELSIKSNNPEYEEIRTMLIRKLSIIEDPYNNGKLFNWICRREELYQGKYYDKYPDILFELKEPYGVNSNPKDNLIKDSEKHKIVSGGHKRHGVFLINNKGQKFKSVKDATSVDVAPTILDLLDLSDLNVNYNFEGKSVLIDKNY